VKLIGTDPKSGKFKLSRKVLIPKPEQRPENNRHLHKVNHNLNPDINQGFLFYFLRMADYIEIAFQNISSEINDLLLARLNEIGFEGFEEKEFQLKAFIPANDFDEISLKKIFSNSIFLFQNH